MRTRSASTMSAGASTTSARLSSRCSNARRMSSPRIRGCARSASRPASTPACARPRAGRTAASAPGASVIPRAVVRIRGASLVPSADGVQSLPPGRVRPAHDRSHAPTHTPTPGCAARMLSLGEWMLSSLCRSPTAPSACHGRPAPAITGIDPPLRTISGRCRSPARSPRSAAGSDGVVGRRRTPARRAATARARARRAAGRPSRSVRSQHGRPSRRRPARAPGAPRATPAPRAR